MEGLIKKKRLCRSFTFVDHVSGEAVSASIPEVVDPSYGMYVWPSAPVLAQCVWFHKNQVRNKNVLELGAGTALPGMVAAIVGGTVTLSDAAHLTGCLDNCYQSCVANNLQNEVRVVGLTWGQFDPGLLNLGRIDIILGSDCFYDPKDFEDILVTVSFLIERNPKSEFWTTYQDRSSDRTLEQLLHKWNLSCRQIPLVSFHADTVFIAGSTLPGNHIIEMLIISKCNRASASNQML